MLAGTERNCVLSMRVPNPSPTLDKNCALMGPEFLSSAGAGVWRKAPKAFPHSNSVLDKFQSASTCTFQRKGRNPAQGSRGLGALELDPSFQQLGVLEAPFQGPLGGPEWLFRGLCFPGCPLRRFQPSGSYPWATDKPSKF